MRKYMKQYRLIPLMIILLLMAVSTAVPETTLTVADVRRLAVEFNRQYLSSQEDITIAKADISQAWADALPNINLRSTYDRTFKVPKIFFSTEDDAGHVQTMELQTGFKNSFGTSVSLTQPIWHGGKVFAALKIAKMYKNYAEANAEAVESEVALSAEQLFYSALLAKTELEVQERALESNTANLDVVEKMHDRGVVSEYELLRARVEQQTVLPMLIEAESQVTISEKQLKSFLGLDLGEPVVLVEDQTDTSIISLPSLDALTDTALVHRPEMRAAVKLTEIAKKAITVARAEYWPSLDAVGAYNWSSQSDDFTVKDNRSESWTAGLALSMNLFPFNHKKGGVSKAKAQYTQALLTRQQTRDDIVLEVEQAYTRLLQAKKSLDIQGATIAAAEEGFKIAQVRYEAGVGTQLEVLSAQTALTQTRQMRAQALFAFRVAKAELRKVTTFEL